MKAYEIRKEAREALQGKWGKGVGIILAYLVISFVFGIFSGFFEENSVMVVLLSIVEIIITIPLSFGLEWTFLKLKRNEDISAFGFLDMGIDNFARSWKIAGRTLLKLILPLIVLIGSVIVYLVMWTYSIMQIAVGGTSGLETMTIGTIIYIIAVIYFLIVSLLYSLTSFIAYDNKEMTAKEVVNESARLMRGNRGKIIWLELSFLGWALLAVMAFGIGYLWLLPYMNVAVVCFYDKLLQNKTVENQNQEPQNNDDPIKEM